MLAHVRDEGILVRRIRNAIPEGGEDEGPYNNDIGRDCCCILKVTYVVLEYYFNEKFPEIPNTCRRISNLCIERVNESAMWNTFLRFIHGEDN